MEKKTALAQLNETLEHRKENCNPADAAVYSVVQHFIEQLKPVEREQIEDAYKEGCLYFTDTWPQEFYEADAKLYFNQTYKQE